MASPNNPNRNSQSYRFPLPSPYTPLANFPENYNPLLLRIPQRRLLHQQQQHQGPRRSRPIRGTEVCLFFSLTSSSDPLWYSMMHRKASLSTQSAELEALETRLRETEEKLRQKTSRTGSPVRRAAGGGKEGLARAEGTGQENQSPRLNVAQQQTGPSRWEGLLPQQR